MRIGKDKGKWGRFLGETIFIVFIVALTMKLAHFVRESDDARMLVSNSGYVGVFIIAFVAGLNVIAPIPAPSFIPLFVEAGFNLEVSIFILAIGTTAADGVAFLLGKLGRKFIDLQKKHPLLHKTEKWSEKYRWGPFIFLFLFAAFVPFPNEVLIIPLGFIGYKFRHLALPLLAGNGLFNYLASHGFLNLFEAL
jgi:membrane protein YqaA with SNARE-associated domain